MNLKNLLSTLFILPISIPSRKARIFISKPCYFCCYFLCTLLNDAKGRSQTVMKVIPILSDLRPKIGQKPSAAVAVAVGAKPSATAVGFGLRSTPAANGTVNGLP